MARTLSAVYAARMSIPMQQFEEFKARALADPEVRVAYDAAQVREARIEEIVAEYRDEMLSAMNRYHGCDRYRNERSCKADVFRVDRVIMPIVRKMLEDASEERERYGADG